MQDIAQLSDESLGIKKWIWLELLSVTSGSECSVPGSHFRGPGFEPTQGVTKSENASRNEDDIWKHSGRFVETLEQVSEMKSHIV